MIVDCVGVKTKTTKKKMEDETLQAVKAALETVLYCREKLGF